MGKDVADHLLLFVSHFKDTSTTSFERHVRLGQITSFRFARSSRQGQRFYPIDLVEVDVGHLPVEGLFASILNSHLGVLQVSSGHQGQRGQKVKIGLEEVKRAEGGPLQH